MNWFLDLFSGSHSVGQSIFLVSLVAVVGLALGKINFRGIGLGVAGCLFSGIILGHMGLSVESEILHFLREFGLILFVYAIGIHVGPGFFSSLKNSGLRLNLMAGSIVVLGAAMVILIGKISGEPMSLMVGIFSGATTNTPSLAAAQHVLTDLLGTTHSDLALPATGYAIAYPFGIIGIILSMLLIRTIFKIKAEEEAVAFESDQRRFFEPLERANIKVTNPNLADIAIKDLPSWNELGVVISRVLLSSGEVVLATDETKLSVGMVVHAIGTPTRLKKLGILMGPTVETDLKSVASHIISRKVVVTKNRLAGKHLSEFPILKKYGVVVTRIARADIEFTPNPNIRLQFGDILTVVGEKDAIKETSKELGDSVKNLSHPQIIPIFFGIALGIILGSIPFHIPGVPLPVKLGLAGGPLLAAILLSRIGNIGPIVWYLPMSSNLVVRELGIALFLSCVGIKAGATFFSSLLGGGAMWLLYGALITTVPLLIVGVIARLKYRLNFMTLCGFLAGSMTDPPALSFASSMATSDAPQIAYATVYPLVMFLRVLIAQLLILFFLG